jgi:hypothetical protein
MKPDADEIIAAARVVADRWRFDKAQSPVPPALRRALDTLDKVLQGDPDRCVCFAKEHPNLLHALACPARSEEP